MDLWTLYRLKVDDDTRRRQYRLDVHGTTRSGLRHRLAWRAGLLLLRAARRLLHYGRPANAATTPISALQHLR